MGVLAALVFLTGAYPFLRFGNETEVAPAHVGRNDDAALAVLAADLVRAGRDVEIGDLGIVNALSVLIDSARPVRRLVEMTSGTLNSSFSAISTTRLDCLSVGCDQQIHF